MISLPPIANFSPFDPSKVQSYRNRQAMILTTLPALPKTKKILVSKVKKSKEEKLLSNTSIPLSPAQQAMVLAALRNLK